MKCVMTVNDQGQTTVLRLSNAYAELMVREGKAEYCNKLLWKTEQKERAREFITDRPGRVRGSATER